MLFAATDMFNDPVCESADIARNFQPRNAPEKRELE